MICSYFNKGGGSDGLRCLGAINPYYIKLESRLSRLANPQAGLLQQEGELMKKYKPYIIAGALVIVILVLCVLVDVLSAENRVYDDLTRAQQIELMKECMEDGHIAFYSFKPSRRFGDRSRMVKMFWEYRTRGR